MIDTIDESELDDSSSYREFAELDLEIRRMSLHADSLLQSIREVSGDTESHQLQQSSRNNLTASKLNEMGRRPHHSAATSRKPQDYLSYEDDDMTEEEERLEFIAESIRESLAESNVDVPRWTVVYSTGPDCEANLAVKSDEVEPTSEILLLGCSIIWAMVMILFVHAQYFLLNEKGQIHFPFGL